MSGPQYIYNEGRVVGYSAYEVYVKQHQSLYGADGIPAATERQWLASSLASGSSLLLKIPAEADTVDGFHTLDILLPENTKLCAANTIVASFFDGSGNYASDSYWANEVKDYGPLISNTKSSSPSGSVGENPGSSVPTKTIQKTYSSTRNKLKSYLKLVDGIVIQPGKWVNNSTDNSPKKDLDPDLTSRPSIRLYINDRITHAVEVLLTGFSISTVVMGESGLGGSLYTNNAEDNSYRSYADGDFLGPGQFPWSNKIIFSVPNSFIKYFMIEGYNRTIGSSTSDVEQSPIIDMQSFDPATYYATRHSNTRVSYTVNDFATLSENLGVLTIYQRNAVVPPALYGTKVSATGNTYLHPIDTNAPGTLKLYHRDNGTLAKNLEDNVPENKAFMRDGTSYVVKQLNENQTAVPVAEVTQQDLTYTDIDPVVGSSTDKKVQAIKIQTGNKSALAFSLSDLATSGEDDPTQNKINVSTSKPYILQLNDDDIYWSGLLQALANRGKIDILGSELKQWKALLKALNSNADYFSSDKTYTITLTKSSTEFDAYGNPKYQFQLKESDVSLDDITPSGRSKLSDIVQTVRSNGKTVSAISLSTNDTGTLRAIKPMKSEETVTLVDTSDTNVSKVIYPASKILTWADLLLALKGDSSGKLYGIDLSTTFQLFTGTSAVDDASKLTDLLQGKHYGGALVRNRDTSSSDSVIYQLGDKIDGNYELIPIAKTEVSSLTGTITVSDLIPPFFALESKQTSLVLFHKRIKGKLSDQIKQECGFDYDTSANTGSEDYLNPAFAPGGYYSHPSQSGKQCTRSIVTANIPAADRNKYYYIPLQKNVVYFPSNDVFILPVNKDTHEIDVVVKFDIMPKCKGDSRNFYWWDDSKHTRSTDYLGSWWSGKADGTYDQSEAKITNKSHPKVSDFLPENSVCYLPNSLAPADLNIGNKLMKYTEYYNIITVGTIFDNAAMTTYNINDRCRGMTLAAFCKYISYADLWTGEELSPDTKNRAMPLRILSNNSDGKHGGTNPNDRTIIPITINNKASTVNKTQYYVLEDKYKPNLDNEPLAVVNTSGRLSTMALSMADKDGHVYSFNGAEGDIEINLTVEKSDDNSIHYSGRLTWETLLDMLVSNKAVKLNLIVDKRSL